MNHACWHPHVTVATVVEREGRFLLVREVSSGQTVINQPAGHLDPDETLLQAATRETLEETCWEVELTAFLGIYQYVGADSGDTYLRTSFAANAITEHSELCLDDGIIETLWLTVDEVRQLERNGQMRSPMVLRCIEDYLAGRRFPLDTIATIATPST